MKTIARFLLVALAIVPFGAHCANVPTTRGNNLTAYNGASGATNNNNWNALMNVRSGADAADMPVADFGNCNAVVLRCAQPKCATGGCTDMNVTAAIVTGCVQSNDACKQYGDDLVQYISAQLVASSTAKSNAAAAAAANAAAAQSAQQVAAMQQQMQQMQSEMAQQNAETVAQLQSALEEQKQLTAQAIADATAARATPTVTTTSSSGDLSADEAIPGLTTAQQIAAQNGVSPDILAREQITGQIMSSIENAMDNLSTLKTTMEDAFSYAGCDTHGNNCSGPKRVKTFKQKALDFFDPYESVLDELYDALIAAQSVGVDITDIYMMLNNSCQVWGMYLCDLGAETYSREKLCDKEEIEEIKDAEGHVTEIRRKCTESHWEMVPKKLTETYTSISCVGGKSQPGMRTRGGFNCSISAVIPPEDDVMCVLQKTIVDDKDDPVQRNWLWREADDTGANIRVGCASSALEASAFFRDRKKQAKIDIETLEKLVVQDAPTTISRYRKNNDIDDNIERIKHCAVGTHQYENLQKWVATKTLPKNICMTSSAAINQINNDDLLSAAGERALAAAKAEEDYNKCTETSDAGNCRTLGNSFSGYTSFGKPVNPDSNGNCCATRDQIMCVNYARGEWGAGMCNCPGDDKTKGIRNYRGEYGQCMNLADYCKERQSMPRIGLNKTPEKAEDNNCYKDCTDYCKKDYENPDKEGCRDSFGDIQKMATGQTCVGSWDKLESKCKCETK